MSFFKNIAKGFMNDYNKNVCKENKKKEKIMSRKDKAIESGICMICYMPANHQNNEEKIEFEHSGCCGRCLDMIMNDPRRRIFSA